MEPTPGAPAPLQYGEGGAKLFGMENFGNSCYCNSILQCLYYTTLFRQKLLQHRNSPHEPKSAVPGSHPHIYKVKYDQLLAKKLKEQGKVASGAAVSAKNDSSDTPGRPLIRNSIFGKFSSSSMFLLNNDVTFHHPSYRKLGYLQNASRCETLSAEQRLLILKTPEYHDLEILVTRPSIATPNGSSPALNNAASSHPASSTQDDLADSGPLSSSAATSGVVGAGSNDPLPPSSRSSHVIVGIPSPEPQLQVPITPFSANPLVDARKRAALVNGPILNVDLPLLPLLQEAGDSCLLYALKDLFEAMAENQSQIGVVSPLYFIKKLKEKNFLFRQANMHHDAHEFCNYLVNETIESLTSEMGSSTNWCTDIFQGLITNETKCLLCEKVSSKDETFLDLSIDIPPGESAYSLTYSLNNFSKLEHLSHQNKFYCNTCLSLQEAVKTINIKKTPEVLIINFKRFKYDEKLDRMVKLFDSILYPLSLRLFNTTGRRAELAHGSSPSHDANEGFSLYSLYALVVHIGGGPMHGHYIALCKSQGGLWFLFDDETVELVEESYVLRFFGNGPGLASAYILFYEKVDTAMNGTDYGLDFSKIYNGADISVSPSKDTNPDNSAANASFVYPDYPTGSDLDGDCLKDSSFEKDDKSVGRTSSLLKKTFMFDTKGLDGTPEPAHKSLRLAGEGPLGTAAAPGGKSEKKLWVTGLKRRESKADTSVADRKASVSSTNTSASATGSDAEEEKLKRRGSIFSFKRKK